MSSSHHGHGFMKSSREKEHIEGSVFCYERGHGCYYLGSSGTCLGGGRFKDERCHVCTSRSGNGFTGKSWGVGRIFGMIPLLLQMKGKRVQSLSTILCTNLGQPIYLSYFLFLSCLLLISRFAWQRRGFGDPCLLGRHRPVVVVAASERCCAFGVTVAGYDMNSCGSVYWDHWALEPGFATGTADVDIVNWVWRCTDGCRSSRACKTRIYERSNNSSV